MLDIPERQLRLRAWAGSQRPSRALLLEELRRVPGGADPALLECFPRGAAFHHAGTQQRSKRTSRGLPCRTGWQNQWVAVCGLRPSSVLRLSASLAQAWGCELELEGC
jgi:hypothetical protein